MANERERMIYVVDDDEAVRASLEALLVVSGYEVMTYDSAESFLDNLNWRGGCLLVDLNMPGLNGLELLKRTGDEVGPIAAVVLTANRDDRIHDMALALGAHAVLPKPVPRDMLLGAIRGALEHAA